MPRKIKRTASDSEGARKQVNVSFEPSLGARLQAVADSLSIDASALIRMIVRENLTTYERRAQAVRDAEAGKDPPKPEGG